VLFNTLAYAKFFSIVFLLTWLLVRRSVAVWVPWIGLAAVTAFSASLWQRPSAWIVCGSALSMTWLLSRRAEGPAGAPDLRALLASALINTLGLGWLLRDTGGSNVLSSALVAIGVPNPAWPWLSGDLAHVLGAILAAILATLLLRAQRVRLLFLVGASYVFYAHWDYRFLFLIFGSSSVDYWLGRKIGAAHDPRHRRRWLIGTVVLNLGVLAIFKYLNFGIDTATVALEALGVEVSRTTLQIALPVGISFFTFESMSYVIDVYRRDLPAHESYLEYLSFVAFFPHLVAGPIVRPRDLLPQLGGAARWDPREGSEGLYLIAWGLLKKVAISDYLALNLIDRVFDAPAHYSALECYVAVVAYAIQIYCDFSGYTDVAIGSALLLGIRFPLNFNAPYKAHDIRDFWRRWHISLSTWLRDYLYIPLGGSRSGSVRTTVNLMLTMLLGGLWHGASWTFVAWGGLHGTALAVQRTWGSSGPTDPRHWRHWLGVILTFHFVCLAWIFFRANTFTNAWAMLSQLSSLTYFAPNLHWRVLVILGVGIVTHLLPERWYHWAKARFIALPAIGQGVVLCLVALTLREMISAEAVPFVYFQF
jgi:D-alanyl-lipoteichoic acid acyltransferase DltB (MBOAT superfamily)